MTGKRNADQHNDWNVTQIDNRYYHEKYGTISCPHCGCTLSVHVVMPFYECGGQFGEVKINYEREGYGLYFR